MAIHWQVKFKSLRTDTLYTANIYDDSYSGSPVQLTGASNPFETQEDDSDDFFASVRLQSGYLRIANTGKDNGGNAFDWRDLIPSSDLDKPVTLTNANYDVLWCGFIQPQNFGIGLYNNPQIVELPLQCPISVTEGIDVNYTEKMMHNFAYLLKQVVESIPSVCRPDYFVFQGADESYDFLTVMIDWQNFLSGNESRFTMYECLAGMCRFWGWTVRIWKKTLYFYCPDDAGMVDSVTLTKAQIDSIAAGSHIFYQSEDAFTSRQITDIFVGSINTDSQLRGPAKIVVGSESNEIPDLIVAPFDDLLEEAMDEAGWNWGISYNGTIIAKTNDVLSVDRDGFEFTTVSGKAAFNMVMKYEGVDAGYGESINVLSINVSGSSSNSALASFQTKYMHSFSQGFFVIHGTTYRGGDEYINTDSALYQGNREMFMDLGIGYSRASAKWWNGKAWQNSYTRFTVTLGNKKPDYFSRYWNSAESADRTNVLLTGDIYGYLFADFFGSYAGVYGDRSFPETDGQKSFNLRDFSLEFFKNNVTVRTPYPNSGWNEVLAKKSKRAVEYKAQNNNRTREEYTEENIFASENSMRPGYAVLITDDGEYFSTYSYGGTSEHPEQHKADRIADYWSASKRKILAQVLANGSIGGTDTALDISPSYKITIDGTTLYPISISNNWRDDIVNIVLMEI